MILPLHSGVLTSPKITPLLLVIPQDGQQGLRMLLVLKIQLLEKAERLACESTMKTATATCLLAFRHCFQRLLSSLLNLLHERLLLRFDLLHHFSLLCVNKSGRIEIARQEIVQSIGTNRQRSNMTNFGLHAGPFVELVLEFLLLRLDSLLQFLHATAEHCLAGLLAIRRGPLELLLLERVQNCIVEFDDILLSLTERFVGLPQLL